MKRDKDNNVYEGLTPVLCIQLYIKMLVYGILWQCPHIVYYGLNFVQTHKHILVIFLKFGNVRYRILKNAITFNKYIQNMEMFLRSM